MSDSGPWPPGPSGGGYQPDEQPSQGGWGQPPQPPPPYGAQPGYGGSGGWQQPGAAGGYAGQQPWASGPPPMGGGYGSTPPGAKPNSGLYLTLGILETLFCCLPFGIVAIVFAAQINSRWNIGDYAGAEQAARRAKTWCIVAAACGVVAAVIWVAVAVSSNNN